MSRNKDAGLLPPSLAPLPRLETVKQKTEDDDYLEAVAAHLEAMGKKGDRASVLAALKALRED